MRAIVMAGGGGTRLWPMSREDFPKQFLSFGSERSLLQTTVERLAKAPLIKEVLIATNTLYLPLVKEQIEKLRLPQKVHILVETVRRNTAPAIALAVKYLETFCGAEKNDPILVLPSDHVMNPESLFFDALEQMESLAKDKWMITFGIRPTRPETGFGYIQIGSKKVSGAFRVERFVEKPDLLTAQKYLQDPHFFWNSGMFLFSPGTFWHQIKLHAPQMAELPYADLVARFADMPDISIDYAIMEKSKELLVCPLSLHWSDIGSWDSVYDILEKDANQNVKIGAVLEVDTKNSLIISQGKKMVATIGLDNILVVVTDDAILIGKKGESQQVRLLTQLLHAAQGKVLFSN